MSTQDYIKKLERDLVLKNYSPRSIATYTAHVRQFLNHFEGQPPETVTNEQIKDYIYNMLRKQKYSASWVRGAFGAFKYFYHYTLAMEKDFSGFPIPKLPQKLPVILSHQEILSMLKATSNLKHSSILMLLYTSGLRISELLNLNVKDIDSSRMLVRVRAGKGQKDRYTILSAECLELLRRYWTKYRPKDWLFEGMKPHSRYSCTSVRQILKKSLKRAGITKAGVCVHSLRHSFATHLLEQGADIVQVRNLLGHTSIKTTMRYLHVRKIKQFSGKHPLDALLSTC